MFLENSGDALSGAAVAVLLVLDVLIIVNGLVGE